MNYSNLLSTEIPNRDIKEILEAINFINEKLPELVTLTQEELAALPKMGVDTINFVTENLKEAQNKPAIVPENVDVDEITKDVELIKAIFKILDPLKNLEKKLEDSALLAGSEAYLPSISIYNAMKADVFRRKHEQKKVRT
jgi:hypothetical protein